MKRTHLALLAMAILASGCDKSTEELLIGTWDCNLAMVDNGMRTNGQMTTTYNDDKSFQTEAEVTLKGKSTANYSYRASGTWALDEKILTDTPLTSELLGVRPSNHPVAKVLKKSFSQPQKGKRSEIISITDSELKIRYLIDEVMTCTK